MMHPQPTSIAAANMPTLRAATDTRLRGSWLLLVQILCAAIASLAVVIFVVSLPINFRLWQTVCVEPTCNNGQIGPVGAQRLSDLGLSVSFYAVYLTGLSLLLATVFGASALTLVLRRPDDWLALFVALMLVTFGTITFSDTMQGFTSVYPEWWLLAHFVGWFGDIALMLFFFIFPTGRFVPRWTPIILLLWGVMQGLRFFLPDTVFNLQQSAPTLYIILFPLGVASGLFAQIYRYQRVSAPAQRQQTKWVVFSVVVALSGFLFVALFFQGMQSEEQIGAVLLLGTIQALLMLLIPMSIAIAVLRYRLWEIDPIINRTLVYGALTISVISLYVLVVGGLGVLFQGQGNFFISVLATGVAAFLFEPLRTRLQRAVNRLTYGERDAPYEVLTRLSERLKTTVAPDAILPALGETVAQALKLPYVALALKQDDAFEIVASHGNARDDVLCLPLIYQTETVGQLIVATRTRGEIFTPVEQRLLEEIARQGGVTAHAVRLTHALQRSRERLVSAREEERRRLRRDLHDGLGPALANLTLQIETARDLLVDDPERADALLADLTGKAQAAITDIRRLVYELRPPALDEFGLIFALREQAAQYEYTGLHTTIVAPEPLPPLPAAVEVAAYRIAQEALTNVARHAQARTCVIQLEINHELRLEICDDGRGLPAERHLGVGLTSMRERADELGGTWVIESTPESGTCLVATLPLLNSAHE
ncbi:MAG: GAF domain-containing sensor histidine kinase [Caldilineaceae bacterium]|nr:GAF domain-containing sensor histidine kinase [Caldilineaceae bacterium]